MLKHFIDRYLRYPTRGWERLRGGFALPYEAVVKFAFDPRTKQVAFAENHDIAASLLRRAGEARGEMVTATIMITGKPGNRNFELLDYSVSSVQTPVTQALKDEIAARVGEVIARGGVQ